MRKINLRHVRFNVSTKNDFYVEEYGDLIESQIYDPDTIAYLFRNINSHCLFYDIGAANGGITLKSAALVAKVYCYEPNPNVFKILDENINENLKNHIISNNRASSNTARIIKYSKGQERAILSDIVFSDSSESNCKIKVLSLKNELSFEKSSISRVMKIDIEAAEYSLLKDTDTLLSLKQNKVTAIVAIHQSFSRKLNCISSTFRNFRCILLVSDFLKNYSYQNHKKIFND